MPYSTAIFDLASEPFDALGNAIGKAGEVLLGIAAVMFQILLMASLFG